MLLYYSNKFEEDILGGLEFGQESWIFGQESWIFGQETMKMEGNHEKCGEIMKKGMKS